MVHHVALYKPSPPARLSLLTPPFRDGPAGLSRLAYARKVYVASKTGYLMKKSGASMGAKHGMGKIKFMNYVAKKRFFVLTGTSLMYHHDHRNLDDSLNSKVHSRMLEKNTTLQQPKKAVIYFFSPLISFS